MWANPMAVRLLELVLFAGSVAIAPALIDPGHHSHTQHTERGLDWCVGFAWAITVVAR